MDAAANPEVVPPISVPDCEHRGIVIELRDCPTCDNQSVKLKVYACDAKSIGVTLADCAACLIPRMCWRGPYRIAAAPGMIRCDYYHDEFPDHGLQCQRCKAGLLVDLTEHRKRKTEEQ